MGKPHTPNTAQLNQLAALQAAEATASANYTSNVAATVTAQAAYRSAKAATAQYTAYIYGASKPGVIDEGSQEIV